MILACWTTRAECRLDSRSLVTISEKVSFKRAFSNVQLVRAMRFCKKYCARIGGKFELLNNFDLSILNIPFAFSSHFGKLSISPSPFSSWLTIWSCLNVNDSHSAWSTCLLMVEEVFLNGPNTASLLFLFFSHDKYSTHLNTNDKSIDGALGTRTQGGNMVDADQSAELWWHLSYCWRDSLYLNFIVLSAVLIFYDCSFTKY